VVIEKPAECESFKAKPEHRCPACGSTKFRGYRKLTVAQRITIGGDGNLSDDAGDEPDADLGDAEAYGDIEGPYTCAECGRDFDIDLPFGGSYLLCIAGRNQDTQRHDTIGELIAALQKLDAERVPLTITIQITQPREE
jgi:DNA-directed RNA polymerase subunit RPC12/RpoP